MYCLVKQPNNMIIEVRVDPRSIGWECLEKVCESLGISYESDYFGLKYENNRGEELWLNLRNPIDRQCTSHTSPLRLSLRVKFWVPPHLLLLESTRHQFYLDAKLDLYENRLLASDWNCVVRLIALIAQSETGDYNHMQPPHNVYVQASAIAPYDVIDKPNDLLQKVIAEHKRYRGMRPSQTEYWLLQTVSELETFGEERFATKSVALGVGPHGIALYENGNEKQTITFANIVSASSHKRTFRLEYLAGDENREVPLVIKLDSSHVASGLYRAITEKHAFYSCETVRSAVTAQFIRDLKGTIVSIFNEDSSLGKKYVFDIRRTCREVYDNARRAIYQESRMQVVPDVDNNNAGDECDNSQEKLARLRDAMTCKICMDSQIDTVFLPCAHVVACMSCASKCDRCPLCRADINQAQKLYLPGEFRQGIC